MYFCKRTTKSYLHGNRDPCKDKKVSTGKFAPTILRGFHFQTPIKSTYRCHSRSEMTQMMTFDIALLELRVVSTYKGNAHRAASKVKTGPLKNQYTDHTRHDTRG